MDNKIQYGEYEKISDDLFFLDYNTVLKFNVNFNHKNKDGDRVGFHSEVQYNSAKYNQSVINIKRRFDYFLSIENFKPSKLTGQKEFIMIGLKDILALRMQLNKVYKWFTSSSFKDLYALDKKNNKLVILGGVEPIILDRLAMSKFLQFEPIVYDFENSSCMGVRISLSSPSNYCDISIDTFMGLKYLIDSINMYESAQLLLNYIQRPAFGTNLFTFDNDIPAENREGYINTKTNRTVKSANRQKSFFSQIDSL